MWERARYRGAIGHDSLTAEGGRRKAEGKRQKVQGTRQGSELRALPCAFCILLAWHNRFMAGLIVLLLSCVACARGPMLPDETPAPRPTALDSASDERIDLRIGAAATLPGTTTTVTFVRVVSDGRCPKGVQCIWEGDAAVELRAAPAGGDAQTITLHTNDRFEREATVGDVAVRLEQLEPYPEADKPVAADNYVVTLRVAAR